MPPLHVLWVQPDPLTRLRLQRDLLRHGVDLVGAADGLAGLRAFRADPFAFDAALLDTDATIVRGHELVHHIGRVRPNLPLVFVGERALSFGSTLEHPLDTDLVAQVLQRTAVRAAA